jgi:hypothetical protein
MEKSSSEHDIYLLHGIIVSPFSVLTYHCYKKFHSLHSIAERLGPVWLYENSSALHFHDLLERFVLFFLHEDRNLLGGLVSQGTSEGHIRRYRHICTVLILSLNEPYGMAWHGKREGCETVLLQILDAHGHGALMPIHRHKCSAEHNGCSSK